MAVVKLKYMRGRNRIKAHLRYIAHRRGSEQGTITRALFGSDGLTEKRAAYEMIDSANRGTLFYKIMINPDPLKEDTHKDLDLAHITRQTILTLEKQLGKHLRFVATVHNADHTPLRHIHGIFLIPRRLTKEEFVALRQTAYKAATEQARLQRSARDRVREHPRFQYLHKSLSAERRGRSVRPVRLQGGCLKCGYGTFTGISYYVSRCPICHAPLKQYRRARLGLEAKL
jgi:predicted Zn-ribbon and HTH transcriptional regulator